MPTYPSGPPALWQSNARQAGVEQALRTQTALNADPRYRMAFLASGGQQPSPDAPWSWGETDGRTAGLLRRQRAEGQQQDDYQQRLAATLQGLRG